MATEVVSTIKASGGDYTTLSAWEAGEQAAYSNNFVTADVQVTAECYDDWPSGLSDNLNIDGVTTDSTRFWKITVAEGHRHDGTPQTGFFLKKSNLFQAIVRVHDPYSLVEFIDVENTYTNTAYGILIDVEGSGSVVRNSIAKVLTGNNSRCFISAATNGGIFECCLAYSGLNGFVFINSNDNIASNCVAANCTTGFSVVTGAPTLKNCVAYTNTTNYSGTFGASSTHNATSTGSDDAPGGNSVISVSSGDFVDASGGDYHITTGSALYEAGTDLSGTFTTDIDGDTWAATWSIGFDQPAATGGATDLIIADATHSHTADALGLTSSHLLTVADSTHAHSADNVALTTQILLAIAEAFHDHAADNLTLTLAGSEDLVIADATHAHAADNIGLTTLSVLVVAEALHTHLADNLTLNLAGTENLVIADALHAHSVDNLTLTSELALVIAESAHAHASDNLVITSEHVLAVADAIHAHLADNLTLSDAPSLQIAESSHAHTADNLGLTSDSLLAIADAAHAHLADNVSLTYAATLAIIEAMHAHSADNVVLNFADLIGKLERIFAARSERRIFTAASERRIFKD